MPGKTQTRSGTGTKRAQSERTQLHLLRTATWLFSERGFHGTSIRDIAEAAGVAVSAMYYYADSKEELLDIVMREGLERLIDGSRQVLEGVEGPSEQLATLVGFHVALHARNPRTTRVIDQEFRALAQPARKRTLARRDDYEATWATVLSAGAAQGEFAPRGRMVRLALLQMCNGVAYWYQPRGELSIPELCGSFADMGLALVGARRDGGHVSLNGLALAPMDRFMPLVEIASEPRRKPPGA